MANHYAPPQSNVDDVAHSGQGITDEMMNALRGTKGWVLLIGILLLIGAAFMVLAGVGIMFAGAAVGTASRIPGGGAMMTGMGFMYIVFALIYIFPGWFLIKYSSAIGRLLSSGQVGDMEDALNMQRKFWKFMGILSVIMMAFMVIGIIAAIALPAYMAYQGALH